MSRRKIWSIPIAALAIALLFGALWMAESPFAKAQSSGPSVADATFFIGVDETDVGTVTVKGLNVATATPTSNALVIKAELEFMSGPGRDKFSIATDAIGARVDSGDDAGTQPITITAASPDPGVYKLTLKTTIDTDDDDNSDDTGGNDDDANTTKESSVTIYVIGTEPDADKPVPFHVDPLKAFAGQRISTLGKDVRTNPQSIELIGMGPNSKIVPISQEDGEYSLNESNPKRMLHKNTAIIPIEFFVDNDGKIIAKVGEEEVDVDADTISIDFDVGIDEDTTKDGDDSGDETDNDVDFTVSVYVKLTAVASLSWTDGKAPPYAFTMLANDPEGSVVGQVYVDGAAEDGEFLDGILLDSKGNSQSLFAVEGVKNAKSRQPLNVVYNGNGDAPLTSGMQTFRLSVNGDSGLALRTVSNDGPDDNPLNNLTITINPVNAGPAGPATHPVTVKETNKKAGTILNIGDVIVNISPLVTDTRLFYALSGDDKDHFEIGTDGIVKVKMAILDNVVDTPAITTTTAGVTTITNAATYKRPGGDTGELLNKDSMYSDIRYEFKVNVSDGNAASSLDIAVTAIVDVNEPVSVSAATAKGTYVSTAPFGGLIYDVSGLIDGGDEQGDEITYEWSVDDAAPFDINKKGDKAGKIKIVFPGRIYDQVKTFTATVKINDGFDNTGVKLDDKDVPVVPQAFKDDATVTITITAVAGRPPDREHLELTINEDAKGKSAVVDLATHEILIGKFPGAVSYDVVGGDGRAKFDVSTDGKVTVKEGADLDVDADGADDSYLLSVKVTGADKVELGEISVVIDVQGVNEKPSITTTDVNAYVAEDAQDGHPVKTGSLSSDNYQITSTDPENNKVSYNILGANDKAVPFEIDSDGKVTVKGNNALDHELLPVISVVITASDGFLADTLTVTIEVGNSNEAPEFVNPKLVVDVSESVAAGSVIATYTATDTDEDTLEFTLKKEDDTKHFALDKITGELTIASPLDYETEKVHLVEVNVTDPSEASSEIQLTVNVLNENDNAPVFDDQPPAESLNVPENTTRGNVLDNYAATDADGDDVYYKLDGANAKSFEISATGDLMTLESLDADRPVPCGAAGCEVGVVAMDRADGSGNDSRVPVRITVTAIEDSVSTLKVRKANPVPGTGMGVATTALAGTKASADANVPERPSDLPSTYYMEGKKKVQASAPMNFVDTEWANWGTVLRIEITSQSPGSKCGNGNQCVVINVNSESADDSLNIEAYRLDTPAGAASNENKFVAAVMLVELDTEATPGEEPVYKHTDGSAPRLKVDEEDEVEIEFGNVRSGVDVENESPEIDNFSPAHEKAFDDSDVDYAFTITDAHSGLPEAEDLPDTDGDDNYTSVVALISRSQCETHAGTTSVFTTDKGVALNAVARIEDDETLYCPGRAQNGEFVAAGDGTYGFAPIRDDKDFDEVDDGYDVETTIVLTENQKYYVTFIVCDNAGNCAFYDPDGNDDNEELAQITVDTLKPDFVEARTGLNWDSTDNEYDDDRSFIQVIFNELTQINPETVEIDDFVVEGHTVAAVYVFETPDADDVVWADSSRYAAPGNKNKRGTDRYRDIENTVFIELEEELLADETPDVTLVPNGIEDGAGNEQDDGEQEANDWISPKFTIVSIVSPRETTQSQALAGDDDEVVVRVTSDERLDQTRPTVTVTYVNAPDGTVDTAGVILCDTDAGDDTGTRDRGEIVSNDDCQDNNAATGGTLNNSVEKISNTEWIVTITEPKDTGYYNFYITGIDRSPQENRGSEGVNPDSIVSDFFDSDGDVNVDDAVFFEGDIHLSRPNVRVSGEVATDNEPDVEYRTPLFVELDFTVSYAPDVECKDPGADDYDLNCVAETKEYAKDNFDSVTVTLFELDGVDITDSVKTTDDETFLVTLENISIGDHTVTIQALDRAGNALDDALEIDFEVSDRDPFAKRLSPGWNLVSLPGEPADSSIAAIFGASVEVRTVYTYDPVIPGGWMVAVRETLDSDWQGDLTEISGQRGYWVLSDAIQDWEVAIPRLAGGASGTGTPIQPPVIPLYAGWNLIPVTDVRGNALDDDKTIDAETYLQSLDDGLDLARVLGFNTIKNEWSTILDPDSRDPVTDKVTGKLDIGSAYWVFVREAASLVPGGTAN